MKMEKFEKLNSKSFIGNKRLMIAAAIAIISLLLLSGLGMALSAHAEANNENRHVHGTFTTQRSYVSTNVVSGLTVINYNVVSTVYDDTGAQVGRSQNLNTLAIDSTGTGRATGFGTDWGTVGDSSPGLYSAIITFTITTTTSPAQITGNFVIVNGSGQGGLTGICGSETFTGTVDLSTGAGSFTYDLTAQFGGSCNSN